MTVTTTAYILKRDGYRCAYCGGRAWQKDHVVPKQLRQRHQIHQHDERYIVAACGPCNWRKGTLRRYPSTWTPDQIALLPHSTRKPWRPWDGDPATLYAA